MGHSESARRRSGAASGKPRPAHGPPRHPEAAVPHSAQGETIPGWAEYQLSLIASDARKAHFSSLPRVGVFLVNVCSQWTALAGSGSAHVVYDSEKYVLWGARKSTTSYNTKNMNIACIYVSIRSKTSLVSVRLPFVLRSSMIG